MLTVVNGRINVVAMKYLDCHHRLFARVARIGSNMPRAIEGFDLEAAHLFAFRVIHSARARNSMYVHQQRAQPGT